MPLPIPPNPVSARLVMRKCLGCSRPGSFQVGHPSYGVYACPRRAYPCRARRTAETSRCCPLKRFLASWMPLFDRSTLFAAFPTDQLRNARCPRWLSSRSLDSSLNSRPCVCRTVRALQLIIRYARQVLPSASVGALQLEVDMFLCDTLASFSRRPRLGCLLMRSWDWTCIKAAARPLAITRQPTSIDGTHDTLSCYPIRISASFVRHR